MTYKGDSKRHGLSARGIDNSRSFAIQTGVRGCPVNVQKKLIKSAQDLIKRGEMTKYNMDFYRIVENAEQKHGLTQKDQYHEDFWTACNRVLSDEHFKGTFGYSPKKSRKQREREAEKAIRKLDNKELNRLLKKVDKKSKRINKKTLKKKEKQKENALISFWKSIPDKDKSDLINQVKKTARDVVSSASSSEQTTQASSGETVEWE